MTFEAFERATAPGTAVRVLTVTGEVDTAASGRLAERLAGLVAADGGELIVDLSEVRLLSPAAVTMLLALADDLSCTGARLRVVTGSAKVLQALKSAQVTDALDTYDTLDTAIGAELDAAARRGGDPADETPAEEQIRRLSQEVQDLRAKLRTRPLIARALGMLQERYRLADMDAAFGLLREASQLTRVKMVVLAKALVDLPPPGSQGGLWPAERADRLAPELTFWPPGRDQPATYGTVLTAVLDAALLCTRTEMGDVRLLDDAGGLRSSGQRGLTPDFAAFLDRAAVGETAGGLAVRRGRRVIVTDVATDPIFADAIVREMHLAAGIRAVQCTPLLATDRHSIGVVSTYHEQAGHRPTTAECAELNRIGAQATRWIEWQRRDAVLGALAGLHERATGSAGTPAT